MIPSLLIAIAIGAAPESSAETIVRFSVQPMPMPKPALRYQLLPEVRELNPGNSVQWYLRCFAEQRNFFFNKEPVAERTKYLSMPLSEVPGESLRSYGGSALSQADWAARLDNCDWEALRKAQGEDDDQRVIEIGPIRELGRAFRVRLRGEIARKDFDSAIRTTKTMFALARHLGMHPTLAANCLGIEIANLAMASLEEMVQQPGCPNLYWALAELPCPLVEIRKGLQGERARLDTILKAIPADAAMSEAAEEEFVSRISGLMGHAREQAGLPPRSIRTGLNARIADSERVAGIRTGLLRVAKPDGLRDKLEVLKVLAFSPRQLVLLDEKRALEALRDDEFKLASFPPWQADALSMKARPDALFADLLPPPAETRTQRARLDRRIALLRCIEALRQNPGRFPATLEELRLPLPLDPFSGRAFAFKLDSGAAHLISDAKDPAERVHYEIKLRSESRGAP